MQSIPAAQSLSISHLLGYAICKLQKNEKTHKEELICLSLNEDFSKFMNTKAEDLVQKSISFPDYDLLSLLNKPKGTPNPFLEKDGHQYRVNVLKDSIIPNQVIVSINDLTHSINAQQKELQASLDQAKDNFRSLIHNSPMPMVVANEEAIIEGNKALLDLLGYETMDEVREVGILGISPAEQPSGMASSEMFMLTIEESLKHGSFSFEWAYKSKDGSLIISENTVTHTRVNGSSYFNCTIKDVTEIRLAQKKIAEEQQRMIEALSIPITPIFKKILLLPLIGALTEKRVRLVIESALEKISDTQSKVIILDVSGASDINIQIASHQFKRLAAATELMGCITILSGMQPKLAEGLISLDLDLSQIRSVNNLQSALHQALIITNYEGINLAIQR